MGDLWSELESFENDDSFESHKEKVVQALKRIETWNLFNATSYESEIYWRFTGTTFNGIIAANPRLQVAIRIANQLMDKKVHGYAARSAENKRRMESNLRDYRDSNRRSRGKRLVGKFGQ
ncbi:hypothetical protein Tco_1553378 [Tanacetum coccineum]